MNPWLGCSSPWLSVVQKGQERRERGAIAIYIRWGRGYQELYLKNRCELVESLWIRITVWGNKGKPHGGCLLQSTRSREAYSKCSLQLQEALQTLVLLGDSIYPCSCWKNSNVSCRQSRRLREFTEDNLYSRYGCSPCGHQGSLELSGLEAVRTAVTRHSAIGSEGCGSDEE